MMETFSIVAVPADRRRAAGAAAHVAVTFGRAPGRRTGDEGET